MKYVALALLLLISIETVFGGDIIVESKEDECRQYSSCSICISQSACTWCVTKSRCTKQACGNDNVIYPQHIQALMSGPEFCPRVKEPKQLTIKSGTRELITVRITQIYLYMAFTPWKCKISVDNKEKVVPAALIGDKVYCESVELKVDGENAVAEGNVVVMWAYNKSFDGSVQLKVCRCDLLPTCKACVN
ncbi:uncharacterized protein LOC126965116 [Leptidea sinapis]|uniref:uncharacterized protein LOC126965116 n=1 Tax=Leptidea sinapis TaxID=189913 RepID=UPI002136E48B|nr:uncharacterized protein LOC126965116 [Leptidea sinapis]